MEAGRLDRVRIDVAGEISRSRPAIATYCSRSSRGQPVRRRSASSSRRSERAGRSNSTSRTERRLRQALDDWGSDHLQPDGIARLHSALVRAEPER